MKKEELIELYPDLVKKIAIEFCHKVILLGDKEEEILWEEYLSENKFKPQFLVREIKFANNKIYYLTYSKEFCELEGTHKINYDLGIELIETLGEITVVSYDKVWYSIGDIVFYHLKEYKIISFDGEIVKIEMIPNDKISYCFNVHISNINKK